MPGEEREKSEGGNDLNEQQIESIVVRVLAAQHEKGKATQDLGTVKKEVGELKGELQKIKEGMHCTPDGKYCFRTPEGLSNWMIKQGEKLNSVETKIAEVIRISEAKPAPPGEPGLVGLAKEDDFNRLSGEQRQRLKGQINELIPHPVLLDLVVECSKSDHPERCDVVGAVTKRFGAGVLAGKLSIEGKGKIMSMACTDRECRVQLEKEQEMRIYKKDEQGKWSWMDEQPKTEKEEYLERMRRI